MDAGGASKADEATGFSASSDGEEEGVAHEATDSVSRDVKLGWSKFTRSLYEMASDPSNAAAIGFSAEGDCLEIRNSKVLGEVVLPKYYRHQNVSSFIRQLNNYSFRTIPSGGNSTTQVFHHEHFKSGRLDLLHMVMRKSTVKAKAEQADRAAASAAPRPLRGQGTTVVTEALERERTMELRLRQVEEQNRRLILENGILMEENKRLRTRWNQSASGEMGGSEAGIGYSRQPYHPQQQQPPQQGYPHGGGPMNPYPEQSGGGGEYASSMLSPPNWSTYRPLGPTSAPGDFALPADVPGFDSSSNAPQWIPPMPNNRQQPRHLGPVLEFAPVTNQSSAAAHPSSPQQAPKRRRGAAAKHRQAEPPPK